MMNGGTPKFQSTRPRGARLAALELALIQAAVSIHAPAWGATGGACCVFQNFSCFNPRARVGRDSTPSPHMGACGGFNPRARVGRDLLVCFPVDSD